MEKEKNEQNESSTSLWMLPEVCIAEILALTSPSNVCRLSLVSKSLLYAADSDSVWAKFLPSDYLSISAQSPTPIPDLRSLKDVYVYLSHNPLFIDEGRKIFSLEKWSGKICYFLGARDLTIIWGDTPQYWEWISLPESRFSEVAKLKLVWWLEIWGTIRAGMLSPRTSYTAYFVYKLEDDFYVFEILHMEVSAGISGVEPRNVQIAFLSPPSPFGSPQPDPSDDELDWDHHHNNNALDKPIPKLRDDGWFELELGDFFTENKDDYIEFRMEDVKTGYRIEDVRSGCAKRGLIVEGIEIRPTIAF